MLSAGDAATVQYADSTRRKEKLRLLRMRTEVRASCRYNIAVHRIPADANIDRQIPSILSYVEGEELHGGQAKAQLVRNSKNTVAYFRDFLGQEYVVASIDAGRPLTMC